MNDLQTQRPMQSGGYSAELTVELAKMLSLVAPTSMTAEQQELWLRAAIDSLQDIRADEVAAVSHEIRRTVTRHNQIVPAIADKVAELRNRRRKDAELAEFSKYQTQGPSPFREREPQPYVPFTAEEIERMPKWLRDCGLRTGFLVRKGNQIIDETLA